MIRSRACKPKPPKIPSTQFQRNKRGLHDHHCLFPFEFLISKIAQINAKNVLSSIVLELLEKYHGNEYCSLDLHEHSRSLNHFSLIDHNPRGGVKEEFEPADAIRYNERSNARLKDEYGGNNIWVKGSVKVMSHLMFGILTLAADQLMRLRQ
jgi:hypothetical protein